MANYDTDEAITLILGKYMVVVVIIGNYYGIQRWIVLYWNIEKLRPFYI